MIKNKKLPELNTKDCEWFFKYINFDGDFIEYECLCCNKNYEKNDGNLKKRFFDIYKFSNLKVNKFILWLQKGVYSYEYMDDWEKFNETFSIIWKRLLLQSPKYGRYYWSRVHACKKSF